MVNKNPIQIEVERQQAVEVLFGVLDSLCKLTDRNIFVVLPEDPKKQIPYLKEEIQKCVDLL